MDGTWHILLTVVYWGVSEKLTYSIMHVFQFLLMTSLYWSQNLFHITVTREISIFSRMFSLTSIVMRHTTKGNECGCMFACEMTPYLNSGNTEECIPSFNIQNIYLRVEGCNQEDHKIAFPGLPKFISPFILLFSMRISWQLHNKCHTQQALENWAKR